MSIRHRLITAAGIGVLALLGTATSGTAQPAHADTRPEPNDAKATPADAQALPRATHDTQSRQPKPLKQPKKPKRSRTDANDERARNDRQRVRLAGPPEEALARRQEQRLALYREQVGRQQAFAREQAARLQRQNRVAQLRAQQQYAVRLRQQQLQVERQGRYDYTGDPYATTPYTYRYARGGRYYETNQYGIDVLRQAIDLGYGEGRRAGEADRADRWRGGYEDASAYQDASYGYRGRYVDRDDYSNYFREGFRRGYDDGYGARPQYGHVSNGRGSVLPTVLQFILHVEVIR